jgi:hypothetical protein
MIPFKGFLFLWLLVTLPIISSAQIVEDYLGDESDLYAETKQVNQFFRRFNGEEDFMGERYYPEDKDYRSPILRRTYLNNLFNEESGLMTADLKEEFIDDILQQEHPKYLNFHGGDWFAEVTSKFSFHGIERYLTLFLELEKDTVGSKWVITNVYFEPFHLVFADQDSLRMVGQKFLHPMSHELDFINLVRAFQDQQSLENYIAWKYKPDYLTLFIYEFKMGNLQFNTIARVKFHFFQVDGWYFEISEYNRKGNNSGWLISTLLKINQSDKEILTKFIYHE